MVPGEDARSPRVGGHSPPPPQSVHSHASRAARRVLTSRPAVCDGKRGGRGGRGGRAPATASRLRPVCTDFESHAVLDLGAGFESSG